MRGALTYRIMKPFVSLLVMAAMLCMGLPRVGAVNGLDAARDIINDMTPQRANVSHDVGFSLPVSSVQITPSDWILITLPNYENVTGATEVVGGFGTPTFYVTGNTVKVTGMSAIPGTGLEILGITATNPPIGVGWQVIIQVAEDPNGSVVRNQATVVPTDVGTFVTVSATISTPLSAILISGFTAPSAFTTLTENDTVVGTTSADGSGAFTFSMSGINPGDHTFRIFSSDAQSRNTSQTVLQLYLLAGNLTTASGIILSSTIQLDKSELNPGETLTIFGSSKPLSQINIFTTSPLRTYTTTSNSAGAWTYTLPAPETLTYVPGQYRTYTIVQDGLGTQSIVSNTLNFTVTTPANTDDPPCGDISHGDLNCDTRTNLTDFSILLFHWKTTHRKADINRDGNVNLTDFSIMMFYFRR